MEVQTTMAAMGQRLETDSYECYGIEIRDCFKGNGMEVQTAMNVMGQRLATVLKVME